jgi:DNA-binding MarR family transcriptional regulator
MINYMPKLVDRATYSRRRLRASGEQIAAWQALARALNATERAISRDLAGSELDPSEYDVLVTLAEGPAEGLRPRELAADVLLTKSGLTRLVDRLAGRGLVERRAFAADARGQLVALTRKGRYVLTRAAPGMLRALGVAMGGLSAADLAALKRMAEHIEEAATAHSLE